MAPFTWAAEPPSKTLIATIDTTPVNLRIKPEDIKKLEAQVAACKNCDDTHRLPDNFKVAFARQLDLGHQTRAVIDHYRIWRGVCGKNSALQYEQPKTKTVKLEIYCPPPWDK